MQEWLFRRTDRASDEFVIQARNNREGDDSDSDESSSDEESGSDEEKDTKKKSKSKEGDDEDEDDEEDNGLVSTRISGAIVYSCTALLTSGFITARKSKCLQP